VFEFTDLGITMAKIKRYFGKKYNVDSNLYFEEYMSAVSKGIKFKICLKILKWLSVLRS
jgi:hypothetical protein